MKFTCIIFKLRMKHLIELYQFYQMEKKTAVRLSYLMQARRYQKKVWNKNAVSLIQYRVIIVKTIAICWLFILQHIKALQLVKHLVHAVLLEGAWLRRIFFRMICRLGTFLLFWQYVWTQNFFFFFSARQNFIFFHTRPNFFFFFLLNLYRSLQF